MLFRSDPSKILKSTDKVFPFAYPVQMENFSLACRKSIFNKTIFITALSKTTLQIKRPYNQPFSLELKKGNIDLLSEGLDLDIISPLGSFSLKSSKLSKMRISLSDSLLEVNIWEGELLMARSKNSMPSLAKVIVCNKCWFAFESRPAVVNGMVEFYGDQVKETLFNNIPNGAATAPASSPPVKK